jgi:hypothetical protein
VTEIEESSVTDDRPVGAALSRDLADGEAVEAGLDAFIEVRDKQRRKEEGERAEAAAWVESTRRYNAVRDAKLRDAWCEYHQEQAERHRAVERRQENRCYHEPQLRGG